MNVTRAATSAQILLSSVSASLPLSLLRLLVRYGLRPPRPSHRHVHRLRATYTTQESATVLHMKAVRALSYDMVTSPVSVAPQIVLIILWNAVSRLSVVSLAPITMLDDVQEHTCGGTELFQELWIFELCFVGLSSVNLFQVSSLSHLNVMRRGLRRIQRCLHSQEQTFSPKIVLGCCQHSRKASLTPNTLGGGLLPPARQRARKILTPPT